MAIRRGSTVIGVEAIMLAASIGKMFQQCMFANFNQKNVPVTVYIKNPVSKLGRRCL